MFQWLKRLFGQKAKAAPAVSMAAQPLELNASSGVRHDRNKQRMVRLAAALTTESDPARRAALRAELDRRRQFGK